MTTLPIGAFMIREEVDKLVAERNCQVIEDAGQGRRRAVACGGGGIPVFKTEGHFAPGSMPPKGALVEIEDVAVCN